MATGSCDYTAKLWCAETGACTATLRGHVESVNAVCFGPDGLVLASGAQDNSIRLWAVPSGQCLAVLAGQGANHREDCWVRSLCFLSEGHVLASGHASPHPQGRLCFWLVADDYWSDCNNHRQSVNATNANKREGHHSHAQPEHAPT